MKTFEKICKMNQTEVKSYMKSYLLAKGYDVINEDGFLYAKGTVPVLLVAHMDTVHKQQCKEIKVVNGRMFSPQGIGGDDRCGIYIIMQILHELQCSVLLCEDEEKGGIGATKFADAKANYIEHLDVNYMIEFDRKGDCDAVFYNCDNEDFIEFVEDATNFKFAYGSFSDISVLAPKAKLAAVNLSSGYHSPHTTNEYVMYDEMMDTVEVAKIMIKEECKEPFKYIPKVSKYVPGSYASNGVNYYPSKSRDNSRDYYYGNFLDEPTEYRDDKLANIAMNDTDIELEAIVYDKSLREETFCVSGETKAECWMNLFIKHPNICFNDIVDYSWG